jgi:TolB-like protein/Tfp pilus assembly protein PilF/class 3 adenylate cyclase
MAPCLATEAVALQPDFRARLTTENPCHSVPALFLGGKIAGGAQPPVSGHDGRPAAEEIDPMADEEKNKLRLEIAHVLFIDIVGYSKLLIDEQSESLHELNQLVRGTDAFREAEAAGKLIRLPTGDGMALVFTNSIEAPVECALEINQALRAQPSLPLRMGIHSGPVHHLHDVNEHANVAGAGINIAQRVMDCGDAGHILLSKRVADDLSSYRHWQPYLHELGDFEVKHGVIVSLFNLYAEVVGNPTPPAKFGGARNKKGTGPASARKKSGLWLLLCAAALLIATAAGIGLWRWTAGGRPSVPATAAAGAPEKSVAVLPFANLSADKDNAFFANGVQDEILTDLAKIADLKVISRTSVMQYKTGVARNLPAIAAQLGVANVLEGSVQRSANQVRVTAQLINARTDAHVWAETYDRPLDNVFAIQSDIAESIARQLQARLSPQEKTAMNTPPTADFQAFDLYLRAQTLFSETTEAARSREKLSQAQHVLEEALARDPKFLLAWCLLSRVDCEAYFLGYDHTPARLQAADDAVQTALRLQPEAGEAHLALGIYYYYGFRDYERARIELDLARRTLPNNAEVAAYTGYVVRRQGRALEAAADLERSLELDPRNFLTLEQLGTCYASLRRYDDEARVLDRALTVQPGDPYTRASLALIPLDARADVKPLEATITALLAEDPALGPDVDDPDLALCERNPAAAARALANYPREGIADSGVVIPHAYWEGVAARWEGDAPRAQAAFGAARELVEKTVAAHPDLAMAVSLLGEIDAGLGRKEEAIREGRRASELLPVTKDAVDGSAIATNLAQILAWTGEKAAAVEQIAAVERVPNNTLSYGFLKLSPIWDDLRGDARFEALVAGMAPPQTRAD